MIDIRINRLTLFAGSDRRAIDFAAGLNVIVGPYGSGKSSLIELLKYGLGGTALLSEAVEQGVSTIVLDVSLSGTTYSFQRDIGSPRLEVTQGGDYVTTLHVSSSSAQHTELASHFLLNTLGIPIMRVRRTRTAASSAKESISFWDFYRFAYVSQNDMGQSLAGHADSNLDRKRRRAFELMFGLLDERSAELESKESELTASLSEERKRLSDVTRFLEDAGVPSRAVALDRLDQLSQQRVEASLQLEDLRRQVRSSSEDLSPERDAVGSMYARRTQLQASAIQLRSEVALRTRLVAQLILDIEALGRSSDATGTMASIDFRQCPRCLQAVEQSRADTDSCYLCLQPLPEPDPGDSNSDETERLNSVVAETADLQSEDQQALRLIETELTFLQHELQAAEERMRARADSYVAPLFESVATMSAEVAKLEGEELRTRVALAQWDEWARIQGETRLIQQSLDQVGVELGQERAILEGRRRYVVELSETFDEIVRELELAWYQSSSVSLTNYLPHVGQAKYESLSGGQRTVVSVAYHLALLTTGLVNASELHIPSLLILDTPSKYLGNRDAAQVARDYRRLAAIVDSYEYPMQIIVADNDPPPEGVRPAARIELNYEAPLVPGYEHPGPDSVTPIHTAYDEDV